MHRRKPRDNQRGDNDPHDPQGGGSCRRAPERRHSAAFAATNPPLIGVTKSAMNGVSRASDKHGALKANTVGNRRSSSALSRAASSAQIWPLRSVPASPALPVPLVLLVPTETGAPMETAVTTARTVTLARPAATGTTGTMPSSPTAPHRSSYSVALAALRRGRRIQRASDRPSATTPVASSASRAEQMLVTPHRAPSP